MIKINLLPKTINEKRVVRNIAILFGVLLVVILAAGFTYSMKLSSDVEQMELEAQRVEALKAEVEGIQQQAGNVRSATKPIKDKIDFINNVLRYNEAFRKLYEQVARWTYERVTYSSMQCNGTTLQMTARVKNLDDLGRYLLNMYQATDLFSQVSISGLPGYPRQPTTAPGRAPMYTGSGSPMYDQDEGAGMGSLAGIGAISASVQRTPGDSYIDFTVTCTLKTPIIAPTFAGAAAAQGQQQPGMSGGMPTPGYMPAPGAPGGPGAPGPGSPM